MFGRPGSSLAAYFELLRSELASTLCKGLCRHPEVSSGRRADRSRECRLVGLLGVLSSPKVRWSGRRGVENSLVRVGGMR